MFFCFVPPLVDRESCTVVAAVGAKLHHSTSTAQPERDLTVMSYIIETIYMYMYVCVGVFYIGLSI